VAATAAAGRSQSGSTLKVQLKEMSVTVSAATVPAGTVTFSVANTGNVDHEFLIMRVPTSGKLLLSHFRVSERTLVGEVHEIKPGKTGHGTFSLKPGKYFLICNIAGHYQLGMIAPLTVLRAGA
jgi:uncharacterized cupredoxin-like copper-binding protein